MKNKFFLLSKFLIIIVLASELIYEITTLKIKSSTRFSALDMLDATDSDFLSDGTKVNLINTIYSIK